MAGNVNLIDPNLSNINPDMGNGIPQYQDMFIFAELTAIRRGRTILQTNIDGNITQFHEKGGFTSNINVSLLGENQNKNNGDPNVNGFTTNWYDGSTDTDNTYEGFGISKIKVLVNSSYIPQINIEFIDVRGLAFFNRENSPYRVLFDFPPPIFFLKFKGYYGKAITYQMHLVKYGTEFKTETGNYHIDCQFIAISYAPLTDILFRYVVQTALIDNTETLSTDKSKPPVNTLDFIIKLQNLYSGAADRIKSDINNQKYESAQKRLNQYSQAIEVLTGYKTNQTLIKGGEPLLLIYDNTPDSDSNNDITIAGTLNDYINIIENYSTRDIPRNINMRLFISYRAELNLDGDTVDVSAQNKNNALGNYLAEYKTEYLIKKTNNILGNVVSEEDFPVIRTLVDEKSVSSTNPDANIKYVGIDITNYFLILYKNKRVLENDKAEAMNVLNETINNMVTENLGMKPTIYNIFKLILDDVDKFFNVLKKYSISAEEDHHVRYKNEIVNAGEFKDKKNNQNPSDSKIYAFPLVVKQEKTDCNQIKENRIAPIDLSSRLAEPFPELNLIQKFIDSFTTYNKLYEQATLRTKEDQNGDYQWIPFTPADSKLVTFFNLNSPYFGTDSPGGGNEQQPVDLSNLNKLDKIFQIMLGRFYVLSQNTYPYTFYNIKDASDRNSKGEYLYSIDEEKSNEYIKLYAESEAVNLVNSMTNTEYIDLIKNASETFQKNPQLVYDYLDENLNSLFTTNELFYSLSNGPKLYVDKDIDNYNGLRFISLDGIEERSGGGENVFLDNFFEEFYVSAWERIFKGKERSREDAFTFTKENLILIKDIGQRKGNRPNNSNRTKYIADYRWFYPQGRGDEATGDNVLIGATIVSKPKTGIINDLLLQGNKYFFNENITGSRKLNQRTQDDTDIIYVWTDTLYYNGSDLYDEIINVGGDSYNPLLSALMYLSNFGLTTSVFNYYPYYLNKDVFTTPSIIEVPLFLILYTGLIVKIVDEEPQLIETLKDFFLNGSGKNLISNGLLIFADIYDIDNYLSESDKFLFKNRFDSFYRGGSSSGEFYRLAIDIKNMYDNANEEYRQCLEEKGLTDEENLDEGPGIIRQIFRAETDSNFYLVSFEGTPCEVPYDKFARFLSNEIPNGGQYSSIISRLVRREGLICFNEITFRFKNANNTGIYEALNNTNGNSSFLIKNNTFFRKFFTKLFSSLDERQLELIREEEEFKKFTGDEDITTSLYYSFKNIHDKWLSGLNKNIDGYPFKDNPQNGLIGQFAFVDRAMNPIGDTIINPEVLIDLLNDPQASIFTVLSQLLSLNGFEFFPLQSFLKFTENEWEDSFKIDVAGKSEQFPVFVCMYIGGSSSYPTGIKNFGDFDDDGIVDLNNPGVGDFSGEDCTSTIDDQQLETANNDVYSQVRAFKVKYGEQNQNMFFNVKIDSKEFPETNESIQILSQLAGDNRPQAPIPKAQNLYNIFENRAYRATISGLGNATIQPTQYFQLENVPLFNGAYIILAVEHEIIPNKMTTLFSGTKILKYPMPRVLEPSTIVGFDGGSTVRTNTDAASSESVTIGVGTASNPRNAQYNALYELKIEHNGNQ